MLKKARKKVDRLKVVEELTTHKCDYVVWPVNPATSLSGVQERQERYKKPPPPVQRIDLSTHEPEKEGAYIPFDLYGSPKPIVGQNPMLCFEKKKLPEVDKTARKTRPRLIIPPMVPLDDIEDEEVLKILIDYTYTSLNKSYERDAALPTTKIPYEPNTVLGSKDFSFVPEIFPVVPHGWLKAAKHWDTLQNRTLGDPFRTFWTKKGQDIKCSCCFKPDLISAEEKQKIRDLICEHKLRLPYDNVVVGYTGFRPAVGKNVPLEQKPGFGINPRM